MGEARRKQRLQQACGFVTRSARVCEYELCFPGDFGEQSKKWIVAALPEDNDIEIARRALGAPVTWFASTWDGARVDVYVIEDWNNITSEARIVNADATLAMHVALQKRGVPQHEILQQPPIIGPNVARYTETWTQISIFHRQAEEVVSNWRERGEKKYCIVRQQASDQFDIYLKFEEDVDRFRCMFGELSVVDKAA